ncbi:substrate-binding periplasmic protein [Pseudomonas sp. SH1-B]
MPAALLLTLALVTSALGAEKTLRIGTSDWQPYVDQSRPDAGALGRLISAIFAEAGYRVEYLYYPWDRDVLMLQQGQLDAIMPYSCNPSRLNYGICSDPLVRGEIVLFHRVDLPLDWQNIEDLRRYRIGVTLGYSYGPSFDEALQQGQLQVEQGRNDDIGFRLLQLGRVDLHPQDRAVGYAMLRRLFPGGEWRNITHSERYLNREPLRLLFRKDDTQAAELLRVFNAGLRRFAERGDLQRLQQALNSGDADDWQPSASGSLARD